MSGEPKVTRGPFNRILVVEDEPAVMGFLSALLSDRGYQVAQARNGVEAMVAVTAPPSELPQAILLDIGLPLEGGISVLTFLRNVLRSTLPVIVITGRQNPDEEAAVRRLGVTEFLRKPVTTQQVMATLSLALD